MNYPPNQQPLYENHYMGFWIKVFPDHVEFKSSLVGGAQAIPLNQIVNIQLGMMGIMQITIQTTGGQAYSVPTMKKQEAQQAILQAQSRFVNANPPQPILYQQPPQAMPMQPPPQIAPAGTPIDIEIQQVKLAIRQKGLQLKQTNANMASIRSQYSQHHVHGGGKLGGFVRGAQRSGKDHALARQQPAKEKLQREKLALEQQLAHLKALKAQGVTHITH
jgi:hypothetical protein